MAEDERGISTEVGSSLLFENERLRIWEMTLGPGEACHLHQHLYDYAFVYVTQSTIEVTDGDGHAWSNSFGDGFVQFTTVSERGISPHMIRNIGEEEHRQVIVELLGPTKGLEPEIHNNGRIQELA